MEYYVIYDLSDNIIAYIETKKELSNYCGIREKDINYRFSRSEEDYIFSFIDNFLFKIYRFFEK